MENVQQEVLSVLLLSLREKELISEEIYVRAKEVFFQKNEWPDCFCGSGT